MQPAFLVLRVFPPPPPGADVFAWLDSPGAGQAADTWKSFIVQGVVRDVVLPDLFPNILQ